MHETSVSLGLGQNCTMRTLMLQNRADPFVPLREIVQLHYEGWPDFGTPAEAATIVSLARLLRDVISSRPGRPGIAPVVVHCSAGCGRTGTFCTVDSVMNSIDSGMGEGEEDLIYRKVLALREHRMSLVQTLRQYVLCYDCVLYHILSKTNMMSSEEEDDQMKIG
jgi:protein tyrosine phosphatase